MGERLKTLFKFIRISVIWCLIAYLFYYYVVLQVDLVADFNLLLSVSLIGICFSFLFSSAEMALAACGPKQMEEIQEMVKQYNDFTYVLEKKDGTTDFQYSQFESQRKRWISVHEIMSNSGKYNAGIVVGNNIANVAVAAILPVALYANKIKILEFQFSENYYFKKFFDYEVDSFPMAGTEALTFFSVLLAIIIFGELLPKQFAINRPTKYVTNLRYFIIITNYLLGWLGRGLSTITFPFVTLNKMIAYLISFLSDLKTFISQR